MRPLISFALFIALAGCAPKAQVAVVPTPRPTVKPAPTPTAIVIQSNEPAPRAAGGPIDTPRVVARANPRRQNSISPRAAAPTADARVSMALMASRSLNQIDEATSLSELRALSLKFHAQSYEIEDMSNAKASRGALTEAQYLARVATLYDDVGDYADTHIAAQQSGFGGSIAGSRQLAMNLAISIDEERGIKPLQEVRR